MKKIELEIKEREKREMVEIEEEINGTRSYGVFFCKWCEREREREGGGKKMKKGNL